MRAIVYIRWSSQEQSRGSSEVRQRQLAENLCHLRGWELVETAIDSGRSAFHGVNRQEGGKLAEIEKRAAAGELAGWVLVVENLDRLSRQFPTDSIGLLQNLAKHGLSIAEAHSGQIYTHESITENWTTLLTAFIRAGLGHEESAKKSKRIKAAWEEARKRGTTKDGGADSRICPSWIKVVDGEYYVIEERASVIRWIFDQCINGVGLNQICRKLNEDQTKTRWTKGDWSVGNISTIIHRRNVLGEYQPYQKTAQGRTPVGDWTKRYPAIITLASLIREDALTGSIRLSAAG